MTRLMGDAVSGSVATLLAVPGLGMVAPYVTGKGIAWTATELAAGAFLPQATIDQGGQGSPVMTATVRDVEDFAWTPAAAVDRTGWTAARRTIYCNRNDLSRPGGVLDCGWQGDLWLAIPGWQPGQVLPVTPGCTVVAVQNDYSNPAYDLSVVLDPAWPLPAADPKEEDNMIIWAVDGNAYLLSGGRMHKILDTAMIQYFQSAGVPVVGSQNNIVIDAAEEAAMLADFPPGQPVVTVPPLTVPSFNVTGTVSPA